MVGSYNISKSRSSAMLMSEQPHDVPSVEKWVGSDPKSASHAIRIVRNRHEADNLIIANLETGRPFAHLMFLGGQDI